MGEVRIVSLGSGSRGNATLVEFRDTRVLIDAGLSARDLAGRLARVRVDPASLAAILLSHEHHDHARGAERFSNLHRIPVACSAATLAAMNLAPQHFARWLPFESGVPLALDGITVHPFAVPHDAADPVGFVLDSGGLRVGVVTDIGHATTVVLERLKRCHALVLESNHDDELLRTGPYPWHLKQRVSGRLGHLSNDEAAAVLRRVAGDELSAVVLVHLSEKNNTPALARAAAGRALADAGQARVDMRVAPQRVPAPAVEL